jgi:hypothetical protein
MEVQDLILADYAAANPGGKFTLVGAGFSRIQALKMPCIHPLMFILVRIKVTISDKGRNKIEIRIVGEKGSIFKADCGLDVSGTHPNEEHIPLPIQIVNLKFDQAGDYNIEVRVNGELKASHCLTIIEIKPNPAP